MDFLLSLPKTLLDLAVDLLKIKKDDRSRQRLADLLNAVADCVAGIADAIERDEHPTKLCAELDVYINNIEQFIAEETNVTVAAQLTRWLQYVGDAPGFVKIDIRLSAEHASKPRWSKYQRFEQSESIRHIAGLIEGTANLVRV